MSKQNTMDRNVRFSNLARTVVTMLHPSMANLLIRDALNIRRKPKNSEDHLEQAVDWICRAQDVCVTGGVSAGFSLRHGWLPPYPETTGYIIPTFLDYAKWAGRNDIADRALRMADWECEIQLDSGGVIGGVYNESNTNVAPVAFNTAQVILGWLHAYRASGNGCYLESANRAGQWLVDSQSQDGAWRLTGVETDTLVHAYDVRTAWSLLELFQLTGLPAYANAAQKNLTWTLAQENSKSWYTNNAFFEESKWNVTFTHTIAYVMEGFLGAWEITQEPRLFQAAQRTADRLLRLFELRRRMDGDFDKNWQSSSKYGCLTGNAQIAGVWLKLYSNTHDTRYLNAALKLNDTVKRTQHLRSLHPGIRGGIKGSQPFWGRYTPFMLPNWAAKFLIDSLMLERQVMNQFTAAVERSEKLGSNEENQ